MFDERHLQLSSSYANIENHVNKKVLIPLLGFLIDRFAEEWDKSAKLEIGQESYIMSPDESGGWKWEKLDPKTNEVVPIGTEEQKQVEELLEQSLAESSTEQSNSSSSDLENTETQSVEPSSESTSSSTQNSVEIQEVLEAPDRIDTQHWQELVEGSAINPEIAALNFKSLQLDSVEQANEAWEYLMYCDKLERSNTGRLSAGMLKNYAHLESGGWWCNAGVDPRSFPNLQPGDKPDEKLWGSFKPNEPRESINQPGKKVKYEHPPKTNLSIFLLNVPDTIAERIYEKAAVKPTQSDRASGFWYSVWKHNIPITITEGAKKAASLLSQGEAAIGLPGIYAGYRSKDELGNPTSPVLHDELAIFATPQREVKICFDHETRLKTKRNIDIATYNTGQLLENAGAKVSVVSLPGSEKGVDDFIVAQGSEAFEKLSSQALPLNEWYKNNQPPDLRFTIFLKNGEQIKLYEEKGDGTVTVAPNFSADVREEIPPLGEIPALLIPPLGEIPVLEIPPLEQIPPLDPSGVSLEEEKAFGVFKPRPKLAEQNSETQLKLEEESTTLNPSTETSPKTEAQSQASNWARKEQVPIYKDNIPRMFLVAKENQDIGYTAAKLLQNYGVSQDDQSVVYQADAFTIKKVDQTYSIYRRDPQNTKLMEFNMNEGERVTILQKPQEMLPIERQEFLLVADTLKHQKLPVLDEDTRKLANTLSSLSPDGTHKLLESFKQNEVLKILTQTLERAGCDDLEVGNFRIKYETNPDNPQSSLKLLKQEHNGTIREAARFDIERTPLGAIHQVKNMAMSELDLNKLRLLATKLQIQTPQSNTINPTATRDIPLPIHTELAKYWHDLEDSVRWSSVANQGNNEFRDKINKDGKLTFGEQTQLYFKIQLQAQVEMLQNGRTDIILPALSEIRKDLSAVRENVINNNYTPKIQRKIEKQNTKPESENEL